LRASDSSIDFDGDRLADRVAETSVARRSAGDIGDGVWETGSSPTSYEPLEDDSDSGADKGRVAEVFMITVSVAGRTPIALISRLTAPEGIGDADSADDEVAGGRGSSRMSVCTNRELSFRRIESSLNVTTTTHRDRLFRHRAPAEPAHT
jgi:hypothetical protein